jgi:hypothetical protein
MGGGDYTFWLGASADADALIPCADRFWAACLKHEKTIRVDTLVDLLAALGLRLTVVKKDAA